MEKTVKIIPAQEQHIEEVCDITIKAWTPIREVARRELGDELFEVFFANWQETKKADVILLMRSGRGYVAMLDDKIVGFISYCVIKDGKVGVICENAVTPDCRGMGIAPQMYNFVIEKMRGEGVLYAKVHTGLDDGHAPARRAYQKAGFEKSLPSIDYFMKI